MNSIFTVRLYIKLMLKEVNDNKVILLDRYTKKLLTLVYSHSELLKENVFLVDMLGNGRRDKIPDVKCIIFVNPYNSLPYILNELKNPKYESYYIYFTNHVDDSFVRDIAEADRSERVHRFKVLFADFLSPTECAFICPTSPIPLYLGKDEDEGRECIDKTARGILSAILTMSKKEPDIRYNRNSQACLQLATKISDLFGEDSYSDLVEIKREGKCVLLLIDRRHDPISPLLTQWRYEAMVHELVGKGVRDNVVTFKKEKKKPVSRPDDDEEEEEEEEGEDDEGEDEEFERIEILFSCIRDDFLKKARDQNWGVVCEMMKAKVDELKKEMKNRDEVKTVDEIREFFDNIHTMKKLNRETSDHMNLVFEIKSQIKTRNLMMLSKLEQEMVCCEGFSNHGQHWSVLENILRQRVRKDDAIRLGLIYSIRYEDFNGNNMRQLVELLNDAGVDRDELEIFNRVYRYCGTNVRGSKELFGDTSSKLGLKGIFNRVKSALKDVENVFTQHDPLVKETLEKILKLKLSHQLYPLIRSSQNLSGQSDDEPVKRVFVFVVGGITYSECSVIRNLNRQYRGKTRFMIGGTRIHNSRTFFKDMKEFVEKFV